MIEIALLLSLLLHRPLPLVEHVFAMGGIDAVAVVECESEFNPRALRREPAGISRGLFQLYDRYHPQYRIDILLHVVEGVWFLNECKEGRTFAAAVSVYNSGSPVKSLAWGKYVERRRDSWALYIWRHVR
jgi:hypothetical protein